MIRATQRTLLALSISLAFTPLHVFALEMMSDDSLSEVSAQDGIQLRSQASAIDMQRLYWQDGDPTSASTLDLRWDTVNITPTTGATFKSTTTLDFGANAGGIPAISLENVTESFRLKTKGLRVNNNSARNNTFGVLAMETTTNSKFGYFNTNGLFDALSSNGKLTFDIQKANIYLAQPRCFYASGCSFNTTAGVSVGTGAFIPDGVLNSNYNILAFKDSNIKGSMNGKFSIDTTKGLNFNGTLSLPYVAATKTNGFQLKVGVLSNVNLGTSTPNFDFAKVDGFTTASTIRPYWQFGFSGDLKNADISLMGDKAAISTTNTVGLKISAQADFAKSTDASPFVLEMGEPFGVAGASPFTIQFKNWVALSDGAGVATAPATFKFGDAYINLLSRNSVMAAFALNPDQVNTDATPNPFVGSSFGSITTTNAVDENAFSQALRGFELQAYAHKIAFNDNVNVPVDQNWALMPLFYGFSSNLVLYPSGYPDLITPFQRRGIGFDWNVETLGSANSDNSACITVVCAKGTHLLVADTATNKYVGLRNVNGRYSFLRGQLYAADSLMDGVEGLMLSAKNFALDIDTEFAVGDLPNGTTVTGIRNDDEFVGIRLKLAGEFKLALSPAPTNESYIGLSGSLNMTDGSKNSITFTEPVDGTKLQFANMTGQINILPEHVTGGSFEDASRIDVGIKPMTSSSGVVSDQPFVTFAGAIEFAPGLGNADVIRIRDINFIQGTSYRLGEAVITGGRLYTQLDIRPPL